MRPLKFARTLDWLSARRRIYLPSRSITCMAMLSSVTQSRLSLDMPNARSPVKVFLSALQVVPSAIFSVTDLFLPSTVMVPSLAGPTPFSSAGNTMSLSAPVPKVLTPSFMMKRPASVSQPLSRLRLCSMRSRQASRSATTSRSNSFAAGFCAAGLAAGLASGLASSTAACAVVSNISGRMNVSRENFFMWSRPFNFNRCGCSGWHGIQNFLHGQIIHAAKMPQRAFTLKTGAAFEFERYDTRFF